MHLNANCGPVRLRRLGLAGGPAPGLNRLSDAARRTLELCPTPLQHERDMSYPPAPSNIGRQSIARTPSGNRFYFEIEDEIHIPQSGKPDKLIYLQRLKFESDGRVELRLGYYVIGKKPAMRGRWVWGQFATMIPLSDFRKIIQRAERKGWL